MKLEKQCCNLEYADKLKKLGVEQKSLFYHTHSKWGVMPKKSIDFTGNPTSAYTCAELVQMCGNTYAIEFDEKHQRFYSGSAVNNDVVCYETLSNALAAKLIKAIENDCISVDRVNKRLLL